MEDYRLKGKNALKNIFNKEQNIAIFEKNIFESSFKQLKKFENIEDIYLFNIFQFINDFKNNKNSLQHFLNQIKNRKIHWNNNYFKEMIDREIEQDNFLIKPIEIEEGVL